MALTAINPRPLPPIRGVLFDMDGVVLDSEKLYARFWMEACRYYGFPMTREQALTMRSANRKVGEARLQSYFGPEADYKQIRFKRIELMDAYIDEHGVEPKAGIFELMDFLNRAGIASAITSSSPKERIQNHLGSLNLYHRFDKICSGYEVPSGKPAPDIYLYGAKELGLQPGECIAIEDSPTGIESAYRAGCIPIMVPDQDQPDDKTLSRLYAKADSLTDIISLISSQRLENTRKT